MSTSKSQSFSRNPGAPEEQVASPLVVCRPVPQVPTKPMFVPVMAQVPLNNLSNGALLLPFYQVGWPQMQSQHLLAQQMQQRAYQQLSIQPNWNNPLIQQQATAPWNFQKQVVSSTTQPPIICEQNLMEPSSKFRIVISDHVQKSQEKQIEDRSQNNAKNKRALFSKRPTQESEEYDVEGLESNEVPFYEKDKSSNELQEQENIKNKKSSPALLLPIEQRRRKSKAQVSVLEQEFEQEQVWSKQKIRRLARILNLKDSQVYKWNWDKRLEQAKHQHRSFQTEDGDLKLFQVSKDASQMRKNSSGGETAEESRRLEDAEARMFKVIRYEKRLE